MEGEFKLSDVPRKERNFPVLELSGQNLSAKPTQPVLVINSPKTPTLCRKLKASSLDSDPQKSSKMLEVDRDVISMPNTPKRQIKPKLSCDLDDGAQKLSLGSNLARFASNVSISGSQTLKTLPEVMTLQDFSDSKQSLEPIRVKTKGLLERRGSNASLTIDLGSNSNLVDVKAPLIKLNPARSVNNLNLSSFGNMDKCQCVKREPEKRTIPVGFDRRKSQSHIEKCDNCTIYESEPSKVCDTRRTSPKKKCCCLCSHKSRRKSLSNENLYVPPCNICQGDSKKDCTGLAKGHRRACYPRQADLEASQLLSEDFKFYLQNVQYLQTAGNVLSLEDLKQSCEPHRVPKIHQEFWEVPLNLQEKCLVSGSQTRNRYRGVLPNEHSRVLLPGQQSYIHANYIKGPDYTENCYIATQGPMSHTCEDFWQMVWTSKCNCIVMLTNLVEKGRTKCELYFPLGKRGDQKSYFTVKTTKIQDKFTFERCNPTRYEEEIFEFEERNELEYGPFKIQFLRSWSIGECTVRSLSVKKLGEPERVVRHFWFSNWQDHKMANPEQVLRIAREIVEVVDQNSRVASAEKPNSFGSRVLHTISTTKIDSLISSFNSLGTTVNINNLKSPAKRNATFLLKQNFTEAPRRRLEHEKPLVIVHCSAGIGRTGCFLAILNGIQQLRSSSTVDILAILCSLRLHRGGMVQTAEQYELIYRVLKLYADGL